MRTRVVCWFGFLLTSISPVAAEAGKSVKNGHMDWSRGLEVNKMVATPGRAVDVFLDGGRL